ncbi:MAG: ABC transporter ATP-binding protein/permease [Clostridia bacterium]|nr:ABC transporter ATP-binding protein/permease [Clostridia bacterium]
MLELKNITKTYKVADDEVQALKGVSLKFREAEFVSILGQSGCGKTTLLNIIGGLDRYTTGDLIINGKSTKSFKDRDWDAYRNYKVGFVFQSYNLISHQTVLSNVELALTIGGISRKERKERAIKALEEVGLKDHIHKKPNQLSGGQMQRVAIARALVNNPDIILADEPTGALDTKTSVQVMEILKKISKDKLIIMVTHNPELAEQYSSRIIKILDGNITEDSNPIGKDEKISDGEDKSKIGRASMKLWTAFRLSLNNLLTKKARTLLVAFAGSIGIIGIALVQSVSNGFQSYVDSIQEDTLTSYPLTITQESSNIVEMLLSMKAENDKGAEEGHVIEEQYISSMLSNISTNDLRSFNKYMKENYSEIEDDISTIKYSYSIEPNIYTVDATDKIVKLNPSGFADKMGMSSMMMSSSFSSVFSQMIDSTEKLEESYNILAGTWPQNYNEMVIVLAEPDSIADYLVYSLGLRDVEEFDDMITKVMTGEMVEINNEPLELTYEDLMNIKLKLIMPTDFYEYNEQYDVYEDMSSDDEFLQELYDKSIDLKIVGIIAPKDGTTSMGLSSGVSYTSKLIDYIIDYSKNTEIVQKQLENKDVDVISGKSFDDDNSGVGLSFGDLVSVDNAKLQSAFNVSVDPNELSETTQNYMMDISNSITTDTSGAKKAFTDGLDTLARGLLNSINDPSALNDIDGTVNNYLGQYEPSQVLANLEANYVIPKATFKTTYSALLKGIMQAYAGAYKSMSAMPSQIPISSGNEINNTVSGETMSIPQISKEEIIDSVVSTFTQSAAIEQTANTMAKVMTEAVMKQTILTKVGELTGNISNTFASAFNVDPAKISSSFKLNMTEEEITRIITSMMSDTNKTAKTNLISLGYQDKEEPTYISFYFNSFDGKEHFMKFIDSYNEKMGEDEEKVIKYTDTTGILMDSVKIIVNAVTYVLIAFISISLIVSSIMIGIITYISVYERTKEIGILRAIGASKSNISSIFNAETFIIGLLSGLFGIGVTYALIPPINFVLHLFVGDIPLNVTFYIGNAIILVILSVILTLIGGIIPARAASKKDPVIALRTE